MMLPKKVFPLENLLQHPFTRELRKISEQSAPSDLDSQALLRAVLQASGAPFPGSVSQIWPSILGG